MEFTIKELEKIIRSGDFNSLIGKIENSFFDCKSQSYDLKKDYSKRELAKDVSSFANLEGGYILIGPITGDSEVYFGEEVKEIKFIDKSLIDIDQYNDVINDWIYPKIDNIQLEWMANDEDSKGIFIIQIPSQKGNKKPFLIKKVIEEKKNTEIFFGYSKRKQDRNMSLKIEDMHKTIRDGLFYDKKIENRFDNLESIIQSYSREELNEEQKNKDKNMVEHRVNKILELYNKDE